MAKHKHDWDYYGCSFGYFKRCWGCSEVKPTTRQSVERFLKELKEQGKQP